MSEMQKYYVKYKCAHANPDREFEAGPYDTYAQAILEERDISGYEGIYAVRIVSSVSSEASDPLQG